MRKRIVNIGVLLFVAAYLFLQICSATVGLLSKGHEKEIPHILWFTHRQNILDTQDPPDLYKNVQNTIDSYRKLWGINGTEVNFVDDEMCEENIKSSLKWTDAQILLDYFHNVPKGEYKGDICRVASLYLEGGYYFDVDLQVIEPFVVPPTVSFATVNQPKTNQFFQAFVASTAYHPILKRNLEKMISVALGDITLTKIGPRKATFIGPETMKLAFDDVPVKRRGEVLLLEEEHLNNLWGKTYDAIPRQDGVGPSCNWVVHNPRTRKVHFYSRFIGASKQCMKKEE